MADTHASSHATPGHPAQHEQAKPTANPKGLQAVKANAAYLAMGDKAAVKPGSAATRSLLTTLRYVFKYALRRMLRFAKYAAIGGVIAFVGAGVLGTVGSGLAWFAAPGVFGGMGLGIAWATIKFGWRHRPDKFRGGWWSEMVDRAAAGRNPTKDEEEDIEAAAQREENRRVRQDVWVRSEPMM